MSGLDFVKGIRHIEFDWKNGMGHVKIGYSANELRGLDEEVVYCVEQPEGSEYDEILQIDDTKLIPYLSKAIQELSDEVDGLQEENRILKEKMEELMRRVERLEGKEEKDG